MLSDKEILSGMKSGDIVIEPFDLESLGSNSYDVHLGKHLAKYKDQVLDSKKHNQVEHFEIPEEGITLIPGEFYLGATLEYTETHKHVPFLDGKSSFGRLGGLIHYCAGRGDVGFSNHWTLEISVIKPLKVYPGMPIGQIYYFQCGEVNTSYRDKPNAKYNQRNNKPKESMMWKNF